MLIKFKQGDRVAFEWNKVYGIPAQIYKVTLIGIIQGGASGSLIGCAGNHPNDSFCQCSDVHIEPIQLSDGEFHPRHFVGPVYVVYFPTGNNPWLGTESRHSAMLMAESALRPAGESEVSRFELIA